MQMRKALNLSASQSQQGMVDLSQAMRNLDRLNSEKGAQGGSPGSGSLADSEFHIEGEGGRFMVRVNPQNDIRLPRELIMAQALPARRFSRDASRKGWLYLDTWYQIGLWENGGGVTYANEHPPENAIDFDAVYAVEKTNN